MVAQCSSCRSHMKDVDQQKIAEDINDGGDRHGH